MLVWSMRRVTRSTFRLPVGIRLGLRSFNAEYLMSGPGSQGLDAIDLEPNELRFFWNSLQNGTLKLIETYRTL